MREVESFTYIGKSRGMHEWEGRLSDVPYTLYICLEEHNDATAMERLLHYDMALDEEFCKRWGMPWPPQQ